ncbi:hypothetical protein FH972_026864 [Carpinus fangiana]|uniref:Uncharacterized protein n=1 Tax=Carpinus fangiana TaxID=176857 RepID=A0A5N6L589_9ROSI|nr:hypothetical protein FH972_026864 [Carpinus fangiana]
MEPPKLSYEQEWVIQISRALEEDHLQDNDDEGLPVSIFSIPKTLISLKPDAYIPQLVALGPYHHRRLELFEMEHFKLTSAKKVQKKCLQHIKFKDLVNHIAQSDSIVRSCYLRFLEFDQETLAWIFAINASFLSEYLQTYSSETEQGSLTRISSKMAHLIDCTRRKTAHRAILRDVIKLENQIPLFLLREVHSFYQREDHDEALATMLMGFCKDLSPIKRSLTRIKRLAGSVAEEVESASHQMEVELSPLVEEIPIPSVTQLHKIGVNFRPTKRGLGSIYFNKNSGIFYLPVIHLDDNSEVVLRNLVAYEACIAPEVMIFTRYTELMNRIIDTEEDVRILREAGIILNRLKSDEEVATLWNGMTKSVKVTKVPILDKAIEGANTYYSKSWKARMNVIMKKYIVGSWPCLTFFAANIMILLSTLETACSMYNCSKWVKVP